METMPGGFDQDPWAVVSRKLAEFSRLMARCREIKIYRIR